MSFSEELLRKTRKLLSSRTEDANVSDEEARESLRNIAGFFSVLLDWHTAEKKDCRPDGNGTERQQATDQGEHDEP
jgi:hypothetical protein